MNENTVEDTRKQSQDAISTMASGSDAGPVTLSRAAQYVSTVSRSRAEIPAHSRRRTGSSGSAGQICPQGRFRDRRSGQSVGGRIKSAVDDALTSNKVRLVILASVGDPLTQTTAVDAIVPALKDHDGSK